MGQECSSPDIQHTNNEEIEGSQSARLHYTGNCNPAVESGTPKTQSGSFLKRNSLINPAPGTCGTAFRKKNRICIYSESTHDLYEVVYSEFMRLEDLLRQVGDLVHRSPETVSLCHKDVNYNLNCKAYTQRTLKELGIEDNAILSLRTSNTEHDKSSLQGPKFPSNKIQKQTSAASIATISKHRQDAVSPCNIINSVNPTSLLLKSSSKTRSPIAKSSLAGKKSHVTNPFDIDFRVYAVPDLLGARRAPSPQ